MNPPINPTVKHPTLTYRAIEKEIGPGVRKFLESWLNGDFVKLEHVQ